MKMKKGVIQNKRGLEMSISLIVIVVISVFVLIGVLYILNKQTGLFSDLLGNLQGKSNIDSVTLACNSFIQQNADYEYCCAKRKVVLGSGGEDINASCSELENLSIVNGKINYLEWHFLQENL